jgi:hypothetical protein
MNEGENRINIYGPKSDGACWLELRQADGQSFVLSVPASESAVLVAFSGRHPEAKVSLERWYKLVRAAH